MPNFERKIRNKSWKASSDILIDPIDDRDWEDLSSQNTFNGAADIVQLSHFQSFYHEEIYL